MKRLAALILMLSACGSPPAAKADDRIECALDGAAEFARVCTVERTPGPEALLTVRSPGGGFRRLLVGRDGIIAADGAEPARVESAGKDLVEVSIGSDRYRLPARAR